MLFCRNIHSKAFIQKGYYIVSAHADNYLHLTGVHTKLDAQTFISYFF